MVYNRSLFNFLGERYSKDSVDAVTRAFDALDLPEPRGDEYQDGHIGALVFLEEYGLVIRIEQSETYLEQHDQDNPNLKRKEHPLILTPLKTIDCNDLTIEICPAIRVVQDFLSHADAMEDLALNLKQDGLELWDPQVENMGLLRDLNTGEDIVVIIDRNAAGKLDDSTALVRKLLRELGSDKPLSEIDEPDAPATVSYKGNPQSIFNPLAEALASKTPDMQQAYDLCKAFKEQGILVCGWDGTKEDGSKTGHANKVSKKYAGAVAKRHAKQTVPA